MLRRSIFHRAGAWAERLLRADRAAAPATAPPSPSPDDAAPVVGAAYAIVAATCPVSGVAPAIAPVGVAGPNTATGATAPVAPFPGTAPAEPEPLEPHHRAGLALAREGRWNWAQRELERAARLAPEGAARDDLASVREARRQLRLLRKWPRDARAQLALGRAYFELGLGEAAEATLRRAIALAPTEPAAYYLLALEYIFRGDWAEAERLYAQSRTLDPELPPLSEWLAGVPDAASSGPDPEDRRHDGGGEPAVDRRPAPPGERHEAGAGEDGCGGASVASARPPQDGVLSL